MDARVAAHHDHFVGERRNVRAARRAATEHGGKLRDAVLRHAALLEEGVAKVVAVREDAVLLGQESAAAIDEVQTGQAQTPGNFLRAPVFFHGFVEERAALHGRVVGDEHAGPPGHDADAGDYARARHLVAVLPPGRERRKLQKRRAVIDDEIDTLAHQPLAARAVAPDVRVAPARRGFAQALLQKGNFFAVKAQILGEACAAHVDVRFKHGHGHHLSGCMPGLRCTLPAPAFAIFFIAKTDA